MLKVRKWSDTNEKPFDVVYLKDGKSFYQPGVTHSTEIAAEAHKARLEESLQNGFCEKFILDHWLQD